MRKHLPEIGWPVYDLRRRKFGICIDVNAEMALVHVEGDRFPRWITANENEYEYPMFYINDSVICRGMDEDPEPFYIKHVHYHVPNDTWQYTIARQGMKGFDRYVVEDERLLTLVERFISKI